MRKLAIIIVTAAIGINAALGLELSQIRKTITRTEADNTLDGDYTYKVLEDGSVRRTWKLADGKTLLLDFDTANDRLICASLLYDAPVPTEVATADAGILGRISDFKWGKLNDAKVEPFGFKHAYSCKLEGGGYIFREEAEKGKNVRVTLYASTPSKNRKKLEEASLGPRKTAMGSSSGASNVAGIIRDEAARHARRNGGKAEEAIQTVEVKKPAAETPSATRVTRRHQRVPSTPAAPVARADAAQRAQASPGRGVRNTVTTTNGLETIAEAVSAPEHRQTVYIVSGGIAALIVAGFSFSAVQKSKRKKKQEEMYRQMMGQAPSRKAQDRP